MQILMVDYSGKSGMYRYADALCEGLYANGEDVTVLTSSAWPQEAKPYKIQREFAEFNINQGRFTKLHWALDRLTRSMKNISKRNKYAHANDFDIVHIQGAGFPLFDQYFLKPLAKNIPVVLTLHDVMSHYDRFVSKDSFMRKTLQIPHRLIVHFEKGKELLTQKWGIESDRIDVIPHGIMPIQNQLSIQDARQKLDLPENKKIILFFGSIRPNKGLDILLESLQNVIKENPDTLLVIAGALPRDMSFQSYEEKIKKLNLCEHVKTFIEYIPDEEVDLYFSACDMVVLPYTNFESQSGVLLRAYAHEKPVVVSNVGAMGEIVSLDHVGEIVEPKNVKSLALAVNKVFGKLDAYASNYNSELKNKYSWEHIAKMTLQSYTKAIGYTKNTKS